VLLCGCGRGGRRNRKVVDAPFSKRPFRVHIDPTHAQRICNDIVIGTRLPLFHLFAPRSL